MRTGRPEDLLGYLKPGKRVFFQGGPGECTAFSDLLMAHPERTAGVELWSCLIPGINAFDYGSLPGNVKLVTFMASPALEPSIQSGRTELRAMPYSEIGRLIEQTEFDLAVLHASAPDKDGQARFGISCDMPVLAWPGAERCAVFINERMPSIARADGIHEQSVDLAIPVDVPLISPGPSGARGAALEAIGKHAAELVADGAVIQSGIGDTPAAVVAALKLHRDLKIFSGIITPEYRMLADAGALAMDAEHVAGIAWGEKDFYDWLAKSGLVTFRSALVTHNGGLLAELKDFTSIGSALEVDLAGNINLEWRNGRRISSVGGAPDYMRGAFMARGGRSIIALQAATKAGGSRIVPTISAPSIPAHLADAIVTEHGVAQLRDLSPEARAEALIAIAAPEHRSFLATAWREKH